MPRSNSSTSFSDNEDAQRKLFMQSCFIYCQVKYFSSLHDMPLSGMQKTSGTFTCNIMGDFSSLVVVGNPRKHQRILEDGSLSKHQRFFCADCGTHLYAWNENWPELVHPLASCIDSELPIVAPKDQVHIFVDSKLHHVQVPDDAMAFSGYPDKSIREIHDLHGWD